MVLKAAPAPITAGAEHATAAIPQMSTFLTTLVIEAAATCVDALASETKGNTIGGMKNSGISS